MNIDLYNLYKGQYEELESQKEGKLTFSIFDTQKQGYLRYVTLVTNEKGQKKDTLYGWSTQEKAHDWLVNAVENHKRHEENKAKLKEARKEGAKNFLDKIKEGDIFCASWGYEAIWHDFYKVVGKQGTFVLLREMNKKRTFEDCKYDSCSHGIVSCGDEFASDEIIKRKVRDGYINITTYASAVLWDGKAREEANWH